MALPTEAPGIIIGLVFLVGIVQCFFGYRLLKPVLALTGIIIGGGWAASMGYALSDRAVVVLLTGLLGAALGAVLMVALYFVGVFVLGGLLGIAVATFVVAYVGRDLEPIIVIFLTAAGGGLALVFRKFMIIVSTAFGGSWHILSALGHFGIAGLDLRKMDGLLELRGMSLHVLFLVWLALGLVGFMFQYLSLPSSKKHDAG